MYKLEDGTVLLLSKEETEAHLIAIPKVVELSPARDITAYELAQILALLDVTAQKCRIPMHLLKHFKEVGK